MRPPLRPSRSFLGWSVPGRGCALARHSGRIQERKKQPLPMTEQNITLKTMPRTIWAPTKAEGSKFHPNEV